MRVMTGDRGIADYVDNLRSWVVVMRDDVARKAAKRRDTEGEDYWIGQAEAFQEVLDWIDVSATIMVTPKRPKATAVPTRSPRYEPVATFQLNADQLTRLQHICTQWLDAKFVTDPDPARDLARVILLIKPGLGQ